MIDFNDKDLEDLSDEQKQILDELVTDILNWRSDNIDHTGKLSNDEAVQFKGCASLSATYLQFPVYSIIGFTSVN